MRRAETAQPCLLPVVNQEAARGEGRLGCRGWSSFCMPLILGSELDGACHCGSQSTNNIRPPSPQLHRPGVVPAQPHAARARGSGGPHARTLSVHGCSAQGERQPRPAEWHDQRRLQVGARGRRAQGARWHTRWLGPCLHQADSPARRCPLPPTHTPHPRHACSGPHPGRVTEYSRKSARPEQVGQGGPAS